MTESAVKVAAHRAIKKIKKILPKMETEELITKLSNEQNKKTLQTPGYSAALKFIPKESLQKEGYGEFSKEFFSGVEH